MNQPQIGVDGTSSKFWGNFFLFLTCWKRFTSIVKFIFTDRRQDGHRMSSSSSTSFLCRRVCIDFQTTADCHCSVLSPPWHGTTSTNKCLNWVSFSGTQQNSYPHIGAQIIADLFLSSFTDLPVVAVLSRTFCQLNSSIIEHNWSSARRI